MIRAVIEVQQHALGDQGRRTDATWGGGGVLWKVMVWTRPLSPTGLGKVSSISANKAKGTGERKGCNRKSPERLSVWKIIITGDGEQGWLRDKQVQIRSERRTWSPSLEAPPRFKTLESDIQGTLGNHCGHPIRKLSCLSYMPDTCWVATRAS